LGSAINRSRSVREGQFDVKVRRLPVETVGMKPRNFFAACHLQATSSQMGD
jgi:hypothetical protein